MATEIERKFLPKNAAWRSGAVGKHYRQGYLSTEKARAVRVRTIGDKGFLTIKGAGTSSGMARAEYEYEIPLKDADELLDRLCLRPLIEKVRYKIPHAGLTWEVDDFEGENAGLIIMEVELEQEDQVVELPNWVGEEVTDDPRYYNASLISTPYSKW